MKYRVKTDLLSEYEKGDGISDSRRDRLIQEGCSKEWFEKVEDEFEVGDWVYDKVNHSVFKCRGIDADGDIKCDHLCTARFAKECRKATKDEIEEHLVKEAKRRGYSENNTKPLNSIANESFCDYDKWHYHESVDSLFTAPEMQGGYCVYKQGNWAKIVDETPDIEINGRKVELTDEGPNIGCRKYTPKVPIKFAEYIEKDDIEIHRKGENITEQIKKIAEYYDT